MQFRIVGFHHHQAVVGGSTFSCVRQQSTTGGTVTSSWCATKDTTILKSDCRTLNEAKNLCRAAACQPAAGV